MINEWKVFNPVSASTFSHLIDTMKKTFTKNPEDKNMLCYWLSFSCALLKELKAAVPASANFSEKAVLKEPFPDDMNLKNVSATTYFFYQLVLVAFDIYWLFLVNSFKQLDQVLEPVVLEQKSANSSQLVSILQNTVQFLRNHHLSDLVVKKCLDQFLSYIDAQLFNSFIRRRDLFKCSIGFKIKMAVSHVENALSKEVDKTLFTNARLFNHIKEGINLLIMDKSLVDDESAVSTIFSDLNVIQIRHIIWSFVPDDFAPDPVSESVKKNLGQIVLRSK